MKSFFHKAMILSLFGLLFLPQLEAQSKSPFKRKLHFGVKGIAIGSKYDFVPSVPQQLFKGGGTGIFTRFDVERGASMQLELNYTITGWKEFYEERPDLSYSKAIHTINMPLLTHLYLASKKGIRIFLNVGPILGYHFAEQNSLQDPPTKDGGSNFTNFGKYRHETPIQHKLFWGLCGGPGISIPVGKHHRLEFEGRYTFGFGDIWANKRQDPYGLSAERRYSLSFNYCYSL